MDVGDRIGGQLGVELFYPGSPFNDSRWTPTLELIETFSPSKVTEVASWPSREGPLLRLLGIKLQIVGDRVREAKAYLAFREIPPGA
jgi:hypothetical protein